MDATKWVKSDMRRSEEEKQKKGKVKVYVICGIGRSSLELPTCPRLPAR